MYFYSIKSQDNLDTCHTELIRLFNEVIKHRDCSIMCGRRNKDEQDKAHQEGKSKVKYPDSTHNRFPSKGIDVAPYPSPKNWGRISWDLIPKEHRQQIKKEIKELHKYYNFNGYVNGMADSLHIPIRQGHDWDGDNEFSDQNFDDLVHMELK